MTTGHSKRTEMMGTALGAEPSLFQGWAFRFLRADRGKLCHHLDYGAERAGDPGGPLRSAPSHLLWLDAGG